ncbi:MAG: hypothetical protein HUU60_11320 [Armatimonadetes bacterium]|nr:hypothetical protein [Armatimonadota bacterium]
MNNVQTDETLTALNLRFKAQILSPIRAVSADGSYWLPAALHSALGRELYRSDPTPDKLLFHTLFQRPDNRPPPLLMEPPAISCPFLRSGDPIEWEATLIGDACAMKDAVIAATALAGVNGVGGHPQGSYQFIDAQAEEAEPCRSPAPSVVRIDFLTPFVSDEPSASPPSFESVWKGVRTRLVRHLDYLYGQGLLSQVDYDRTADQRAVLLEVGAKTVS